MITHQVGSTFAISSSTVLVAARKKDEDHRNQLKNRPDCHRPEHGRKPFDDFRIGHRLEQLGIEIGPKRLGGPREPEHNHYHDREGGRGQTVPQSQERANCVRESGTIC
jgi:hypothetical protein